MTDQRPPPPILRTMTQHPMFDLLPLAGPRRKVPDVERQTDLVGELLEFDLPQPIATGIAPPTIGRDEDGVGLRIRHLAPMPLPAPDGFDRTLGRVVIDPHTHPATMVRGIVHPIGTNLPQVLVRKIVRPYAFWLPLWLGGPSPIGTRSHEFLLLRIHRNDRLSRTLEHFDAAVDLAKWGLPLRMCYPCHSLARALEALVQVGEPLRHRGMADLMSLALQRRGHCAGALPGPASWRHRITPGRRVSQRFQRGGHGRIMGLERFAPASWVANAPPSQTRWGLLVTQGLTPTAHRPLPQACGLGHHLDPVVPQCERFAGCPPSVHAQCAQTLGGCTFFSGFR